MTDSIDRDCAARVINGVQHTVITDTQPVGIFALPGFQVESRLQPILAGPAEALTLENERRSV